jgi:hypothetical protein
MTECTYITDYEGDRVYQPVKNPVSGLWEDQTTKSIKRNYKSGLLCPCKAYLMEHCDKKFKDGMYHTTNFNYFVSKHTESTHHKEWLTHKNSVTSDLESKSNTVLVERIEELEREKRKDKVDFRGYLKIQETEFVKEITALKEKLALKEQIIQMLESKIPQVHTGNLIDI